MRERSTTLPRTAILSSVLLFCGLAAQAQPPDLSGEWSFQTTLTLDDGKVVTVCEFEGTATIVDSGGMLTGSAAMNLVSGASPPCPAEAQADVTGQAMGSSVSLQLDGGMAFGLAVLDGVNAGGSDYAGGISTQNSPFDATGTWSATRGTVGMPIPTLGLVGGIALILLLASASLVLLRTRSLS